MPVKRHYLLPLIFSSVLLTKCSCDFFGATSSFLVSEKDEENLGAQFHQALLDSSHLYPIFVPKTKEDTVFQAYATGIYNELLAAVPERERPDYDFTFTIIDAPVENAFAVPGGYVYLYTGIVKTMKDESELAGVLGHEIAHVTQHHYREQLAKTTAVVYMIQALRGSQGGQIVEMTAGAFAALAQLKFSRNHESEADEVGTQYLGAIGRNPLGIADYFSRLDAARAPEFLSTHPNPGNRVEDIQAQVNASPELKALAEPEFEFQTRFEDKTAALRN